MRATFWSLIAFVVLCAALAGMAFKTRAELVSRTSDRWKGDNSLRWVEETFAHQPWLWLANPKDIAEGREPIRPIHEPMQRDETESTHVKINWKSERDVHALLERRTERPRIDDTFARATVADFLIVAEAIPPHPPR